MVVTIPRSCQFILLLNIPCNSKIVLSSTVNRMNLDCASVNSRVVTYVSKASTRVRPIPVAAFVETCADSLLEVLSQDSFDMAERC